MHLRTLVPAVVLTLAGVLAGCASHEAGAPELAGLTRTPPLTTAGVVLPQVAADGTVTPFELKAEPGRMLAVFFGYTSCPDVCPTTLADVRAVKDELGRKADTLDVALVTVDPERDTADVLHRYLDSFFDDQPSTRVHALRTDDPAVLQQAQDALLVSSAVETGATGEPQVSHSATLYLVDDTGTVVVEWPFGTSWRAMGRDVEHLLADT